MQEAWNRDTASRLRADVKTLRESDLKKWDWSAFTVWLRHEQRLKATTIAQRRRDLVRMASHPTHPVKLQGRGEDITASFVDFAFHREEEEGKAPTAVVNDYKAFRLLAAFLGLDAKALPKPPTVVAKARPELPSPEEVHALLRHKFFPGDTQRSYENALVQYLCAASVGLGVRATSELHALKLSGFNPERHTLVIEEPKKGSPTRRIYVEPTWLCCGSNVLSLGNWLRWRDKVDPERREEAFFLRPDGRPFPSKEAMSAFLWGAVPRDVFPWWSPNLGRRWCATGRLIMWGWDYYRTAQWLGHSDVEMLRAHYDVESRLHARLHGEDWLYRAFHGKPRRARTPAEGANPPVPVLGASKVAHAPAGI